MRSRYLYNNKLAAIFDRKETKGNREEKKKKKTISAYVSFKSFNVNTIAEEFEKRLQGMSALTELEREGQLQFTYI